MSGYEGETRRLVHPRRPRWEYATYRSYVADTDPRVLINHLELVIEIEGTRYVIDEGLNILGEDGWELVAVQQTEQLGQMGGYLSHRHIFKRPVE